MIQSQTVKHKKFRILQGNEACAEGALAVGMRFFAGYPITPSSEIAELLSEQLPRVGGKFIQMEDEIAAISAVIGASLAGVKSMTATSGPGFSLMQENIGYAAMAEVPCVIVNVQRGGPSTGSPTLPSQADVMQARWGTHGDHPIICITPWSVSETFYQTIRAFNLSEQYRVPVILLLDEIIGHVFEKVDFSMEEKIEIIDREKPKVSPSEFLPYEFTASDIPPMANFGEGYRYHVTGLCHDQTGFPTNDPNEIDKLLRRINRKIERYKNKIVEVRKEYLEDATIAVLAYGSTARSAHHAVNLARHEGIKVGLLRPLVLWPFPREEVHLLAQKVTHIIVAELNLGQVAHEVECACQGDAEIVRLNRVDGEPISPKQILAKIKELY